MKFLDLNGLKQVLKRVVKYDKDSQSDVSLSTLSAQKVKASFIQPKNGTASDPIIALSNTDIAFKVGAFQYRINTDGLKVFNDNVLEKEFPEEFSKLKSQNLFLILASILHTLKEKGIMQ